MPQDLQISKKKQICNKTKTTLFKKFLSDNTQIYPWCRGLSKAEIKLGVVFAMQKNQNKNIPAKRKKRERETKFICDAKQRPLW